MATRTILPTNVRPGFHPGGDTPPLPIVVGSPPHWTDGSDATYSEQYGIDYTNNPAFEGGIFATLNPVPELVASDTATIGLRVRLAVSGPIPVTPRIMLQAGVGTDTKMAYAGGEPAPAVPAWLTIPMTLEPGVAMIPTINRLRDFGMTIETRGKFAPDPGYTYECAWTIYELMLDVVYPSTVAPPCRLWPRGDSLGVGAGRHYPPPNTHQSSPRRAGATTW